MVGGTGVRRIDDNDTVAAVVIHSAHIHLGGDGQLMGGLSSAKAGWSTNRVAASSPHPSAPRSPPCFVF